MALLIDSSVFIDMERHSRSVDDLASLFLGEALAFASITASELLVGVYRADSAGRRATREMYVESILRNVRVVDFDIEVARVHARLSSELTTAGQRIGDNDLIIAATALAHGYDVVTSNVREFERVPGLVVRRPTW
jgi:predicted nucleic acid-binding protein